MKQQSNQVLEYAAKHFGIVLLYHSISQNCPGKPENTIHNVSPEDFERNVRDIGTHFKFVSLDTFSSSSDKSGLASITFDDGYRNVFENALPILEKHNIHGSLFLNPITFSGKYNWRDKVRHVILHNLETKLSAATTLNYQEGKFYRYSKSCLNNSKVIDTALDSLLGDSIPEVYQSYPYITVNDLILDNPFIDYGNHTFNHYVLSSLDESQQEHQIIESDNCLAKTIGPNISRCFSAPFGGTSDVNDATLHILRKAKYESILMSRQKLQPAQTELTTPRILERFMPRSENIANEIAAIPDIALKFVP